MEEMIKRINEVLSGRRGFISIPRLVKELGVNRNQVLTNCASHGLTIRNHGKYGACAYKD